MSSSSTVSRLITEVESVIDTDDADRNIHQEYFMYVMQLGNLQIPNSLSGAFGLYLHLIEASSSQR